MAKIPYVSSSDEEFVEVIAEHEYIIKNVFWLQQFADGDVAIESHKKIKNPEDAFPEVLKLKNIDSVWFGVMGKPSMFSIKVFTGLFQNGKYCDIKLRIDMKLRGIYCEIISS